MLGTGSGSNPARTELCWQRPRSRWKVLADLHARGPVLGARVNAGLVVDVFAGFVLVAGGEQGW